jgi:tRNA-2-methylthio-N6-dimethylallyladenosine synthase
MPSYFIKTYGCQMNVADSEKLREVVRGAGYEEAAEPAQADIVLINTCVVRQHAEDRAAGYITSLSGLKQKNPGVKIGVCGCFVTEPGRDLRKQFPHVDWFIGPNQPEKLAAFLQSSPPSSPSPSLMERGKPRAKARGGGEVVIAHGCDNYCSYCVVPYVRGRETSRPMEEVLAEIKGLIEQGITDITLLGQNVNSYKYGLANLLKAIEGIFPNNPHPLDPPLHQRWRGGNPNEVREGVRWVRFMTSHPKDMSDEIIEAVHALPCVAKEFHLPLQSGDNEVLKKMNRGYTVEYYQDRIAKIRSLMPQARITTDMLVGFPGETEEQFRNSLKLIEELRFNAVNMFAFSARPETTAGKMDGHLPDEVKHDRLQRLIALVRGVVGKVSA